MVVWSGHTSDGEFETIWVNTAVSYLLQRIFLDSSGMTEKNHEKLRRVGMPVEIGTRTLCNAVQFIRMGIKVSTAQ
jgi:hypothetical protein